MKRFLSVLLCLCMIATMMPAYVLGANPNAPAWIKILGMELTDGDYLASNDATTVSEDYTDGDEYVALYKDGVLVLNGLDIVNEESSVDSDRCLYWDYDASGNDDLVVELVEGTTNTMVDETVAAVNGASGFSDGPSLTIQGKGTLNITGATYGIWVWQDIVIKNGAIVNIVGETKSGISNNSSAGSIIIKQGTTVNVSGYEYGVSSDNSATGNFIVQGGNLTVKGNTAAVNKISSDFSGNTVYVGNDVTGADSAVWDGATDITTYKYISLSGFSDTVTTYGVAKAATSNGSFEVDFTESMEGETVTITATPDTDYEVDSVTVTDVDDDNVTVTGTGNVRQFIMPGKNVAVGVTFKAVAVPADFTALNIAIGKAEAVDTKKYTSASVAVLEAALAAAKAIDQTTTLDTEQSNVDAKASALESAVTGLVALADYTALTTAYEAGKTYSNANATYTAVTFGKLTDALAAVELPANKELTVQADVDALAKAINDAIAGLVKNVKVSFTAVAVADDASVAYAKANKVVLVFAEPVADSANKLIDKLNIAGEVSNAIWTTDTVYTLTLKENHGLTNNAEVVFDGDETIFTVSGNAMADSNAYVVGNLTEAYQQVTATNMTATIVKASAKPGVQSGDKIVLVFNAPVYGNKPSIAVNGLTASAVVGTHNTVYEIALTTGASVPASLSYTDEKGTVITAASINGSFGEATAPKVLIAMAVDKDGTAKTAGDEIVIIFDRPTNGSTDITNLGTLIGKNGDGYEPKANWTENNTKLTLTVGVDATIANGALLDVSSMGIMDADGILYAVGTTYKLVGSFGTVTAPVALRAYAVDNDKTELVYSEVGGNVYRDQIVVVFDTPTNEADDVSKINIVGTGYTASLGTKAELVWEEDGTKLVITLGQDTVIKNGATIDLTGLGIMDKDEIVAADVTTLELDIEGSFGYTVKPQITKAVAFTQNNIDYIRVYFNTDVKGVPNNDNIEFTLTGMDISDWKAELKGSGTGFAFYEIRMNKDDHTAINNGTIQLRNIVDYETGEYALDSTAQSIKGAFVAPITPEVLKLVAISNDGSGVAKKGDKIIAVFNTEITGDGTITPNGGYTLGTGSSPVSINGNVVEIKLGEEANIVPGTTEFVIQGFKDAATEAETMKETKIVLEGSFGHIIEPQILSATYVSCNGYGKALKGDKVVIVFNTLVKVNGATEGTYYYEYVLEKDGQYEPYEENIVKANDEIAVDVVSVATGKAEKLAARIEGSLGYSATAVVKSATLAQENGKEVITVVFDRNTNAPKNIAATIQSQNPHLGTIESADWSSNNVLKIVLGADAYTTDENTLDLSEIGLETKDTGATIDGLGMIKIQGTLVPVVGRIEASGTTITVNFSARTNKSTNLSAYTSLFGIGATANWDSTGTKLTIELGSEYTITTGGYIVLNAMGIYDGFSGENQVVGQYKITGAIATSEISVKSIMAQSDDVSTAQAKAKDRILIKFDSATNLYGKAITTDTFKEIVAVAGKTNEEAFGAGFNATASSPDMIVIQLGEEPGIVVGDEITVSKVCFANGVGEIVPVPVTLGGSFDGREFAVNNAKITRTATDGKSGDYKVSFTLDNVFSDKSPRIACVAYSGETPIIVSRLATKVAMGDAAEVEFIFAEILKVTSAKIYVFDEKFEDEAAAPEVLANIIEAKIETK